MDPLAQARAIRLEGAPRQGLSQNRAHFFLHRATVARCLETQLRLGGLIKVANRQRRHLMHAMQATLAPQFLPQGPQDAAIVAVALIANPQPVFPQPLERAAIAQEDVMAPLQGLAQRH